jgi:hypothetical protein
MTILTDARESSDSHSIFVSSRRERDLMLVQHLLRDVRGVLACAQCPEPAGAAGMGQELTLESLGLF